MHTQRVKQFLVLGFIGLIGFGCSKSSAQKEFEDDAFRIPQNITAMSQDGRPVQGGTTDPDDWRIGPDFQGLIDFSTPAIGAYPNPVNFNQTLSIDLDIKGIEAINGLEVFVFSDPSRLTGPVYNDAQSSIPPGLKTITIDPSQFSQSAGSQASDLYRILIYDGRENLISYGDVQVQ